MEHVFQCARQLAEKAALKKVGLTMKYLPTLFTTEYLPSIVTELKTQCGVVNGFFEGAQAELSGQELRIRLHNGGRDILQKASVDRRIQEIIREHFSMSLAVVFEEDGQVDVSQLEPPPGGAAGAHSGASSGSGGSPAALERGQWRERRRLLSAGWSGEGPAGGDHH